MNTEHAKATTDPRAQRPIGFIRRRVFVVAAVAASLLMVTTVALADNVVNDVASDGNVVTTVGGSVTVRYWVVATNAQQDGQNGCNASDGSSALVTINTPLGVTATPASLSFSSCGNANAQAVTFSASAPGEYVVTVGVTDGGSGPDGYHTTPATFTLLAEGQEPRDTIPPVITWHGDIADGDEYYFGSQPAAPTCSAVDDLDGVDVTCSVTGYGTAVGSYTLTASASDAAGNQAVETRHYTVLAWTLRGFYRPVDMNGVFNAVKGGSTVPLKFEVFAGATELTSTAVVASFRYGQVVCSATAPIDDLEVTATGGTALRYDPTAGQFVQNWLTTKGMAGNCYSVTMTTRDGSTLSAFFIIK